MFLMVATQLFWEFCTPKIGKDEPIVTVAYFSDELMKKPWLVGLYRDETTQVYRDYNEPL